MKLLLILRPLLLLAAAGPALYAQTDTALVQSYYPAKLVNELNAIDPAGVPGLETFAFVRADLDNSGTANYIVAAYSNGYSGAIRVLKTSGATATLVADPLLPGMSGDFPSVTVLDLNNDKKPEIVAGFVSSNGHPSEWVFQWTGSALKIIGPTLTTGGVVTTRLSGPQFADLDGDGIAEIIDAPDFDGENFQIYKLGASGYASWKMAAYVGVFTLAADGTAPFPAGFLGRANLTYVLRILNGGQLAATRASSAQLALNGSAIVQPSDISSQVAQFQKVITLADTNVLEVSVTGKSGAFLVVIIEEPSCDVNGDGAVTVADVQAITAAIGTTPSANDVRDADFDGAITANDARVCSIKMLDPGLIDYYSINPPQQSFAGAGGPGAVTVNVPGYSYGWLTVGGENWVNITSGLSGTGPGTVNFQVAANTGVARTATLTIAGQPFTISQAAASAPLLTISKSHGLGNFRQGQNGATYSVTIGNDAAGGPTSGIVTVTESIPAGLTLVFMAGPGWNCSSNSCTRSDALTPGASYAPITVTVNVQANALAHVVNQASVTGGGSTLTASATDPTTVAAGSCTFLLTPPSFSGTAGATTGSVTVTASASNCAWTAASNVPWVTITSGSSGTGNGTVNFSMALNTQTAARSGTLTIAGNSFGLGQAGSGQPGYTISTLAGTGHAGFSGDGAAAASALLNDPLSVRADGSGNVFVVDAGNNRIRKVSAAGTITTVAGNGTGGPGIGGFSGDGGLATSAALSTPYGVAVDASGNLYIADTGNSRIRKVTIDGKINTIAGNGNFSFSGDNGPAIGASLNGPSGVALDSSGSLYVADYQNNRIRKVATNGTITTIAGNGTAGFSGDGGQATSAALNGPQNVAVDGTGNLYIAEFNNNHIRKVAVNGVISTVAGSGIADYAGDGGQATGAVLNTPQDVAVDSAGNLYIADSARVRMVDMTGIITTIAGDGASGYTGDGGPALKAAIGVVSLSVDSSRKVYLADGFDSVVRTLSPAGVTTSMSLGKPAVNFGVNGSAVTDPQFVTLTFSAAGQTSWTASSNKPNITVSPASGTGNALLQITATTGASGIVTVTAPGAVNSPQQIQVNVGTVTASVPFGSFDTPANNTTGVAGAIAVTGWALDNVEVSSVGIWRERVGTEAVAPNGMVFIGNATFVAGARPDVETANAGAPLNYRAGWGYLLLTNFLPNNGGSAGPGNGTYKLHAIAVDKNGNSLDLGTHSITVDNAHASRPFGTIDTPDQGGSASGTAYVNFGWALTQNPYCIATDGSTITVTVDGVALGHPTYNQLRNDIATAFPGLCNSGGAIGYYRIDTTKLANGVHTIGWIVYDNQGRGDGVGSRFINVQNTGSPVVEPAENISPLAGGTVRFRRGFDLARDPEPLKRDPSGIVQVEVEELDRLELDLGAVSGYLAVSDEQRPLPAGSVLKAGIYYWQLAPGFHGVYPLVFVRPGGVKTEVRVVIRAKNYDRSNR